MLKSLHSTVKLEQYVQVDNLFVYLFTKVSLILHH